MLRFHANLVTLATLYITYMLSFKSKIFLFPYFLVLKIRHFLYDIRVFKSKSYPVPVICIGNITVGGTGKTPHTEMIIRNLEKRYRIAVISRGYKRKSKGFRIVETTDSAAMAGDEPLQIKQKFPDVCVSVCKKRSEAIERLLEMDVSPQLILLDDAFQHRSIKPSRSVVLVNYNRSINGDNLLPIGKLRDLPEQIKRADDIIITKAPLLYETDGMTDEYRTAQEVHMEELKWRKELNLSPSQHLYFSTVCYCDPVALFPMEAETRYLYSNNVIYFTGIANNTDFHNYLLSKYTIAASARFPDHKNFSKQNIRHIISLCRLHPTAVVYTTEKDSKRLLLSRHLTKEIKSRLFYIPIEVRIIPTISEKRFIDNLV